MSIRYRYLYHKKRSPVVYPLPKLGIVPVYEHHHCPIHHGPAIDHELKTQRHRIVVNVAQSPFDVNVVWVGMIAVYT